MAKSLIDLNEFDSGTILSIIKKAKDIRRNETAYSKHCEGKVMATLFYEPSTRTQMSFQTAMYRLGGQVIGFDNPLNSSVSKGESLKDTIKIVSGYADILVMRNPKEGSALAASQYASCPVINAGDGGHLHPTQTLTDLATLLFEKGRVDNLTVGLCGDLKFGRTVHSLIKELSRYENNRFILISTPELTVPDYIERILKERGCQYEFKYNLEECIGELDALYMTRIQRERFSSTEEYERQKNVYVLDGAKLSHAKDGMIVMHPLPRVDEITNEVDDDKRAVYFKQAKYGMYARMALILKLLEEEDSIVVNSEEEEQADFQCKNPACITSTEPYLKHLVLKGGVCAFCEKEGGKTADRLADA